ncbi:MAG: hypothetical protein PUP93_32820 [Rhizonema sp. NSF051]|nr:hypothetical protein [Rhizonema sp. NSF051]
MQSLEAMRRLKEPERRIKVLRRASFIHEYPPFYFLSLWGKSRGDCTGTQTSD